MKNKIVVTKPSTSSYRWNQYTIGSELAYKWNRYKVGQRAKYTWNRYKASATGNPTYYWNRHQIATLPAFYRWKAYDLPENKNYDYSFFNYNYEKRNLVDSYPDDSFQYKGYYAAGEYGYKWTKCKPLYTWEKYKATLLSDPTYQWESADRLLGYKSNKKRTTNAFTGEWVRDNVGAVIVAKDEYDRTYYYQDGVSNFMLDTESINYGAVLNEENFVKVFDNCPIAPEEIELRAGYGYDSTFNSKGAITYTYSEILPQSGNERIKITFKEVSDQYIIPFGSGYSIQSNKPASGTYYRIYCPDTLYYKKFVNGSGYAEFGYRGIETKEFIINNGYMDTVRDQAPEESVPRLYWLKVDYETGVAHGKPVLVAKYVDGQVNPQIYLSNVTEDWYTQVVTSGVEFMLNEFVTTVTAESATAYPSYGYFADGYAYVLQSGVSAGSTIEELWYFNSPEDTFEEGYHEDEDAYYVYNGYVQTLEPVKIKDAMYHTSSWGYEWEHPWDGIDPNDNDWYTVTSKDYNWSRALVPNPEGVKTTVSEYIAHWQLNAIKDPMSLLQTSNPLIEERMIASYSTSSTSEEIQSAIQLAYDDGFHFLELMSGASTPTDYSYDYRIIDMTHGVPTASLSYGNLTLYNAYETLVYEDKDDNTTMTSTEYKALRQFPGEYIGVSTYFYPNEIIVEHGTMQGQGAYVDQIAASTKIYPENGIDGEYWYVYSHVYYPGDWTYDESTKEVLTSYSANEYPTKGYDYENGYYYILVDGETEDYATTIIDTVYSTNGSMYPDNGIQGNYWYIKQPTQVSRYPDKLYGSVTGGLQDYPSNDIQDGYWYVLIGRTYDEDFTLDESQIIDNVNYQLDISSQDSDLSYGNVGSASIKFKTLLNETTLALAGRECDCYVSYGDESGDKLLGHFYITSVEKINDHVVQCEGYDFLNKFQESADKFLELITFPITLQNLLISLCQYYSLPLNTDVHYQSTGMPNSQLVINSIPTNKNLTNTALLAAIAELAGRNVIIDNTGTVRLIGYALPATGDPVYIDKTNASSISQKSYFSNNVTLVITQSNTNSYYYGTDSGGTHSIIIKDNILLEDSSMTDNTVAQAIQQEVTLPYSYVPASVTLFEDYGLTCGDLFYVNNEFAYVMKKEISGGGVKLHCYGKKGRSLVYNTGTGSTSLQTSTYTGTYNRGSSAINSKIERNSDGSNSNYHQDNDDISLTVEDAEKNQGRLAIAATRVLMSSGDNSVIVNSEGGTAINGALVVNDGATFREPVLIGQCYLIPDYNSLWIGDFTRNNGMLVKYTNGIIELYFNGSKIKEL